MIPRLALASSSTQSSLSLFPLCSDPTSLSPQSLSAPAASPQHSLTRSHMHVPSTHTHFLSYPATCEYLRQSHLGRPREAVCSKTLKAVCITALPLLSLQGSAVVPVQVDDRLPSSYGSHMSSNTRPPLSQVQQYQTTALTGPAIPDHRSHRSSNTRPPLSQVQQYQTTALTGPAIPDHRSHRSSNTRPPLSQVQQYQTTALTGPAIPDHRSHRSSNTRPLLSQVQVKQTTALTGPGKVDHCSHRSINTQTTALTHNVISTRRLGAGGRWFVSCR
ncbi:uncharacterized protein LOC127914619 isoform X39 [Oncorhynchus keta]|uniref:uncharacterized protein LOC127914619 isoform X36 n=1 Tax=Oncorhynchus keta TaxID=8018 RepID=UPI00227AA6E6|nr:uncharacterized protein LOC127914619 isoform X36 [Oncorhynchus keta]XP_052348163.1 uncharacterized protein LOC127914619 isoform X37 [Oncorhynchus keta]XP_052348164.1 uncharacterized protein LOC127914619 isoform X38 [Oncorhynchus keta]XP_052348165.1 uncharacterized protein LOC127914619 isoform X39 [Oncorhynchus keta]